MRAHAAGVGFPDAPQLVVLGKITAERLKACGLQALYRDASGLGPRGKLRCPKRQRRIVRVVNPRCSSQ